MKNDYEITISLVVACYNIEKYISFCLDSLINQDLTPEEYEIICVNDCSQDNTVEIIQSYMQSHKNIKLINHPVNKRLGAVRNTGRFAAKGKYIWFIDGDDMIKPNVLSNLISICEDNDLEELLFNHDRVNDNGIFIEKDETFIDSLESNSGINYVNEYFGGDLSKLSIVWNHIYKTNYLVANNFLSPEINMGEDGPFAWRTLLFAKKVASISESCYLYRVNETSMTYEFKYKRPSLEKIYEKCFLTSNEILNLVDDFDGKDARILSNLKNAISWNVNNIDTYLVDEYGLIQSVRTFSFFRSKLFMIKKFSDYFNKTNLVFFKSLQQNYFKFVLWIAYRKLVIIAKKTIH